MELTRGACGTPGCLDGWPVTLRVEACLTFAGLQPRCARNQLTDQGAVPLGIVTRYRRNSATCSFRRDDLSLK
jgi:hypothetical protein